MSKMTVVQNDNSGDLIGYSKDGRAFRVDGQRFDDLVSESAAWHQREEGLSEEAAVTEARASLNDDTQWTGVADEAEAFDGQFGIWLDE